jgi:hypothetical protein
MFQKISRLHMFLSRASMWIAIGCLIVGIVGSATHTVPGLEPTHWLIIAVGFSVAACWNVFIGLAKTIKE